MNYQHDLIIINSNGDIGLNLPELTSVMIDGLPLWEFVEKEIGAINESDDE